MLKVVSGKVNNMTTTVIGNNMMYPHLKKFICRAPFMFLC